MRSGSLYTHDMKGEYSEAEHRQALVKLREALADMRSEYGALGGMFVPICGHIEQALRAIDQFDSGMEFIVCIGMLKAGKSTLVNLLTRSANASPMGYGQDTTLRPALIRMAAPGDEGSILIFEAPAGSTVDQRTEQIRRVMDYLRGLHAGEALSDVSMRLLPLSDELLTRVLCSEPGRYRELPTEPLLVVVETPYSEDCVLLRNRKRMILDMPGCDSPHAEVVRDNLYREIGKECDMALILQSSVAPLNEKAVELLREILGERSASTIRLIQNRMEAKAWLKQTVLDAQTAAQQKNARRVFSLLAGTPDLPTDSVNLGMAYAGIFEPVENLQLPLNLPSGSYHTPQDLLAASGFSRMEQELNRALPGIRLAHCRDELLNALRALLQCLKQQTAQLQAELTELAEIREEWRKFGQAAKEQLQPDAMPLKLTLRFAHRDELPDYEALISRTCRSWKDGRLSREEVSGEDVNKCLQACQQACFATARDFLNEGIRIGMLQLTLPEGEDIPLDRYCEDVLIRRALRRGEQALDGLYPGQMRSFVTAQRPELRDSLRNERIVLPLNPKDRDMLAQCHYERMPETSQVPGRFFGTNTVVETYRNVLHYEPFLNRRREIADFYRQAVDSLLQQRAPLAEIDTCVRRATESATSNFHAAVRERLRDNRAQMDSAESALQTLKELETQIINLKENYENYR